jgi:hypothetical protein
VSATAITRVPNRFFNYLLGGGAFLALSLGAAWLSAHPPWQSIQADYGVVRLSFTHSGARNCRDRTAEELAKLPPNMRASQLCDRRRQPVWMELELNGKILKARDYSPSGLFGSGPSRIYERLVLQSGLHRIALRMRDDPASAGFTHVSSFDIMLGAGESIAIDFDAAAGTFYLQRAGGQ